MNEAEELGKMLNDFRQSSIVIHASNSLGAGSRGAEAFRDSLEEATKKFQTYISDNYVRKDGVANGTAKRSDDVKLDNGGTQQ